MRVEQARTEAGARLRPDCGRALLHSGRGAPEGERRRRATVVAASLGLHVAVGVLAALGAWSLRRTEAPAAPVEVVFEASPNRVPALEAASVPSPDTPEEVGPELAEPPPAAVQAAALPQPDPVAEPPPAQPAPPPPALIPDAQTPPERATVPEPAPVAPAAPQPVPAARSAPSAAPNRARAAPPPRARVARNEAGAGAPQPAPTSAPPIAAAPMPATPAPAVIDQSWRAAVAAWVRSRQRYPDAARRMGAEGAATVRFTVRSDGEVIDAQLARAAGSDLLDGAALAVFRGAHAPPFPAGMAQQQVTLTVTVRYRLGE